MYDPITESMNEAAAQQQIEHDMKAAGLHPVFEQLLKPWTPPADDGQQQAQAEPKPWISPIEHLRIGGYRYEARLMQELADALQWALDQIEDDLDFDHQAAMEQARRTLAKATQGE